MALKLLNTIEPAGDFKVVDAADISVNKKEDLIDFLPIILTQREYEDLVNNGSIEINGETITFQENRIYMIKRYIDEPKEE